jgi:hypothetical protein
MFDALTAFEPFGNHVHTFGGRSSYGSCFICDNQFPDGVVLFGNTHTLVRERKESPCSQGREERLGWRVACWRSASDRMID